MAHVLELCASKIYINKLEGHVYKINSSYAQIRTVLNEIYLKEAYYNA